LLRPCCWPWRSVWHGNKRNWPHHCPLIGSKFWADGGASYLVPARAALEQAGADGEAFVATLENDRLVLAEVTLFTAQQADAALTHAGDH